MKLEPLEKVEYQEPVHERDGKFWFWDETWTDEYGPYETKEAADRGCLEYATWLNGEGHFMPPDEYLESHFPEAFK